MGRQVSRVGMKLEIGHRAASVQVTTWTKYALKRASRLASRELRRSFMVSSLLPALSSVPNQNLLIRLHERYQGTLAQECFHVHPLKLAIHDSTRRRCATLNEATPGEGHLHPRKKTQPVAIELLFKPNKTFPVLATKFRLTFTYNAPINLAAPAAPSRTQMALIATIAAQTSNQREVTAFPS